MNKIEILYIYHALVVELTCGGTGVFMMKAVKSNRLSDGIRWLF